MSGDGRNNVANSFLVTGYPLRDHLHQKNFPEQEIMNG